MYNQIFWDGKDCGQIGDRMSDNEKKTKNRQQDWKEASRKKTTIKYQHKKKNNKWEFKLIVNNYRMSA